MTSEAISHYLRSELQIQKSTSELIDVLLVLIQRLDAKDLPGISLSADQASLMAQVLQVRFFPPPSNWTTAWRSLVDACAGLTGFRSGILAADPQILHQFQLRLQKAIDAFEPLNRAYNELSF